LSNLNNELYFCDEQGCLHKRRKQEKIIISLVSQVYLDQIISDIYKMHSQLNLCTTTNQKIVAVVDRWSLFKGHPCKKSFQWNHKIVVVIRRWSLAQV
jgi:hypothetical protein